MAGLKALLSVLPRARCILDDIWAHNQASLSRSQPGAQTNSALSSARWQQGVTETTRMASNTPHWRSSCPLSCVLSASPIKHSQSLHLLLAATAERRQTDQQFPGQYCSLDMLKEVPPSTWHNLMLFKIIKMCQVSQVWCPDQGRRHTCSGHNRDTTVSWSTWGGKKNLRCVAWEESSCGWEGKPVFATEGSIPLPYSLQTKDLNIIYESASR